MLIYANILIIPGRRHISSGTRHWGPRARFSSWPDGTCHSRSSCDLHRAGPGWLEQNAASGIYKWLNEWMNEWCLRPWFCSKVIYTRPGINWANEMNFDMNHDLVAGSIARRVVLQSRGLLLCYGCTHAASGHCDWLTTVINKGENETKDFDANNTREL